MKWPHTDVGQKENHMPVPNSKVTTFPHSEEQSLRQQGNELRRMEGAGGRVAVETTGGALERSAGRPAGPEVHESGDSARENLAVSSRARASEAAERETGE